MNVVIPITHKKSYNTEPVVNIQQFGYMILAFYDLTESFVY